MVQLSVNIDHVATVRQARRTYEPDPVWAAAEAHLGGADVITVHLREDRRHIQDDDVRRLRDLVHVTLNLEMAATAQMVAIARQVEPHMVMLVPEGRQEITTEGGLDVAGGHNHLTYYVSKLCDVGIRVSLFVDPDIDQLEASAALQAPVVELHTGAYCEAYLEDRVGARTQAELARLASAAEACARLGLECHAGHGLTFDTVAPVAAMPQVMELNIGHFLIGEAIFCGLDASIRRMRGLMDQARAEAGGARSA